ncbi:MAG: hypothetical protein KC550_06790 [Nanoarchaeota archaeon]|nr:hypothetical protein [Nanoarchaeota archaeon]
MIQILFVCTGNVFRSMTAEKCLTNYLENNNISNIKSNSAGTKLAPQEINPFTLKRLLLYNIKVNHTAKDLTKELLEKSDLIIAMSTDHQEYIKETFGIEVPLFNEVSYGKSQGVLDFHEHMPNINSVENSQEEFEKYAYFVVEYIYNAIPNLVNNLPKWIEK